MADPIKRGDVATLSWDLDPAPTDGATARVIIKARRADPIVSREGVLSGARVSIDLTADETAVADLYRVEVEVTGPGENDGPTTYPNHGYDELVIEPDLG